MVNMTRIENIEALEKRLWGSADTLRANSNYAINEYFMPVRGLIFLRHAYSRFLSIKPGIEASLPGLACRLPATVYRTDSLYFQPNLSTESTPYAFFSFSAVHFNLPPDYSAWFLSDWRPRTP